MTTTTKTETANHDSEVAACDIRIHDHELCVALYADDSFYADWLVQNIEYDV